jgi:hypothetical protein
MGMRERWLPVAVLAGVLFGVNAVARFIVWLAASHNAGRQTAIGLIAAGAIGVVMIGAGYLWARRSEMPRIVGELSVAIVAGCLFSVIIGPFAGGSAPFKEGGTFFYSEIWHYLALAAGGAAFGVLIAITFGQDLKSQGWKRYAERQRTRPGRRVVRR